MRLRIKDDVLHKLALEVDTATPTNMAKLQSISADMVALMRKKNGIGLAAPQVGLQLRMFVMEVDRGTPVVVINPEIVNVSEAKLSIEEGCLSYPGKFVQVERPAACRVRYTNSAGLQIEKELYGLEARCFQHEYDHLDGTLMFDRAAEQLTNKENV